MITKFTPEIERQQARIEELEKEKRDILIVFDDNITRRDERIEELEHYKRLNEEWVHEKVEGLTTFEEIEKMVMIADRLNKSNASIRCGWCDAEFETRDQVKEHAYGCKDNPLAQRIAELEQERRWIHEGKTIIVKKGGK